MEDPKSFAEFWPYYLREHSRTGTKVMHLVGTTLALGCLGAAIATQIWWILALAPVVGYGCAWIGHFCIEHNKPATFRWAWWSFIADFKMYWFFLTGRLGEESRRTESTR